MYTQMQPSQPYPHFFTIQFSEHEIKQNSAQISKFFPFAAIIHCPNSRHVTPFTSQKLYFFQPIFTRRTSEHCPEEASEQPMLHTCNNFSASHTKQQYGVVVVVIIIIIIIVVIIIIIIIITIIIIIISFFFSSPAALSILNA
jgi:hypothetical protein